MMTQNAKPVRCALAAVAIGVALSACSSTGGSTGGGTGGTPTAAPGTTIATAPTAGAGSSGGGGAAPSGSATAPATVPAGSSGGAPGSPPTGGSASAEPVGVAACTGPQLAVSAGRSGAATGHISQRVVFTNTSRTACTLYGFPGVAGLDKNGAQKVQAQRVTNGYLGTAKETMVRIAPGGTASALVGGVDVPSGNATSCPTYPKLLVTPPGTRASTTLAVQMPGCPTLVVYPVVAGVPVP